MIVLLTLAALVGALLIAFATWQRIGFLEESLSRRLDRIERTEARAAEASQIASPPPTQPVSRGPDPDRVYAIGISGAPVKGPVDAPVTIVEFSDFQCPFCGRVLPTLEQLEEVYGDRVRLVWKHLPLDIHPQAPGAHMAAVAAYRQGRFWEFHDRLFANQRELNVEKYLEYARELGLDLDRFRSDLADLGNERAIQADQAEAAALGITSTPGFFINGRYLRGAKPYEQFAQLIDEELERLGLPVPEVTRIE
ncbi:MAG: DsbA family protein [Myxococcales bacterium]|nr:DsbA family protein [Myxococcales bacterium]